MTADALSLLDWKRRVFELYAHIRDSAQPADAWAKWCRARDHLFHHHPQSPIPPSEREAFGGLSYFAYDPDYRVRATVEPRAEVHYDIAASGDGSFGFTRFAVARFSLKETDHELELYWLDGYSGGLFVPFRDETSGRETYGAGRYLLDTVKGADLGAWEDGLVFDFNFSYNPSCSYDPQWVCPLAPPPNRVGFPIAAGERHN